MSKRKIRLLIALMSFALLGLIGFQAYWLRFMLETKRENFAKDVRNSLEQVVRKLEKQEILVLAERQKISKALPLKRRNLSLLQPTSQIPLFKTNTQS